MNRRQIPASFHWMIPIAEEILEQYSRDADITELSDDSRSAIQQRLTQEMRRDLEKWIALTDSEEAGSFNMMMVLLDEMGLLESSDPTLNYEYWRSQLRSPSWGKVRGGAQQIGEEYLDSLNDVELSDLDSSVEQVLQSSENTNTRIWLTWLRCQIDKELDVGRGFLRKIIDESSTDFDEQTDVVVDACRALVSMPHVSKPDLDSVIAFMVDDDSDEFNAAVVLEAFLASTFVTREVKKRTIALARKTGQEEILAVADEYIEGDDLN